MNEKLLTLNELHEVLNVKKSWIRYQIFKKNIPYKKIGRLIRFSEKEVQVWINNQNTKES